MPINMPQLPRLTSDALRSLDYQVMRHAFDSHNELGRMCDECVYQADLAARLNAAGIHARREVPIQLSHENFVKHYALDLVVDDSFVYELKVVASLQGEHQAQLLNYLYLTNTGHGKLINFRPGKVESRFVNAPIDDLLRRKYRVAQDTFSHDASALRDMLMSLLDDWGLFLDLAAYTEALTHLLGGEERVLTLVPMTRAGIELGNQRIHLFSPDSAFRVTGFKEDLASQEQHLKRLLALTPLRQIHWINLCRDEIRLTTLT